MSSLRPTEGSGSEPNKTPTRDDLHVAAFEHRLRNEIAPLLWEVNERINRLDSQEKEDEPAKRDMFGKSAWDYSMIKYKINLGELKDDLIAQRKLLGTVFNGLGPSVLDEKEEVDRYKRIMASASSPLSSSTVAKPAEPITTVIKPSEVIHSSDGKQEQGSKQKTSETKAGKESRQKVSS